MKIKTKEITEWTRRNLRWIILFIGVIGFLVIAEDVWNNEIMKGDIIGYEMVSMLRFIPIITPIAKFLSFIASAGFLIILSIILLVVIKNKKIGLTIALNLGLVSLLNVIIKNIIQRPRPTEYRLIDETGYSFPSGHSMASMAFYGFLIYLIFKFVKNEKLKITLSVVLSLLIVSIGISRIYLGVHYTSDVLGGFLVSLAYLAIYTSLVKKFVIEKEK